MKYLGLLAGLILCLSLTVPASAGVVVESIDFESPTFTAGPIQGQPVGADYTWLGALGSNSGASSVGDFDGDADQELQGQGFIKYADFADPTAWTKGKPYAGMVAVIDFDFTITTEQIADDDGSTKWLVTPYFKPDDSEWAVDENGNYYISNAGGSLQCNLYIFSEGLAADGNVGKNVRLQWRPYGGTKEKAWGFFDVPLVETTYSSRLIIDGVNNLVSWAVDGTLLAELQMNVAPVNTRMFMKEYKLVGTRDVADYTWGCEFDNVEIAQLANIPEPATMLLLGSGLFFGGLAYRKRR